MSKSNLTHSISRAALILVLALCSTTAWATITGSGTASDPYLINSSEDWETFAQNVSDGTSYADQFVKLAADITVTTMAGTRNSDTNYHAFSGTLDAFVEGSSTINHCWSTVAVSSTQTGWVDGGAFVARVSGNATLNMSDCAFHGSVTYTPTASSGGSMVGFTQENATVNLTNCLYSPTALELTVSAYSPHIFVSGDERGNLTNCYYNAVAAASILENEGIDASGMTDEALAAALGAGWHVSYGMVLPSGLEAYVVTLYDTTGEVTLHDGDMLTGTGGENTHVKIAHGATMTLSGVNITAYYNNGGHQRPGITCLGDAVIVLAEGMTNDVKGGYLHSGIHVPQGHTLTIQGSGTLNATGGEYAAGIGSDYYFSSCGHITISGGTVNATGGYEGAGIGSGYCQSSCGDIILSGGTVTANGGDLAAGIGSGQGSSCGNITISGGTVTANGGENAAGIGNGDDSSCGHITISGGTVTANGGEWGAGIGSGHHYSSCQNITISGGTVTANGGEWGAGIGSGYAESSCENITISGGTVTANGGLAAAGSGSGYDSSICGDITITNGVTYLVATAGSYCYNAIGAGDDSSCQTVTIGGVETGFITQSPYTYPDNVKLLTSETGYMLLEDGDILTGTGGLNTDVKIADGATVTFSGVTITAYYNNSDHQRPGITCLGDAVIVLAEGTTNNVMGGYYRPGIYVPQYKTLTLQGNGTLNVTGGWGGAGIGSGGDYYDSCGNITINGGTVTANGGERAAGIGSGLSSSCGNITITNGVTCVVATKGQDCDNTIGAGYNGSCGTVTIGGVQTGFITQSPFVYTPNVVILTPEREDVFLQNGNILFGTGGPDTYVEIADGATVTLRGVNITAIDEDNEWPGIYCEGNAVIILAEGTTNEVKGGNSNPGIYVPEGHTLTLQGSGTVNATGGNYAAGIGGGWQYFSCGNINISGGTVTANGGHYAAGIGSGEDSSCGTVTITNGVTMVTATAGEDCDNAIGAGDGGSCQTVTIGGVETGFITQSPFTYDPTVNFVYTLAFNANGGTGTMADASFMYNVAQNLPANGFTSTVWGQTFDGWATSPDGEKVYDDGQSVSNLTQTAGATVTLYAKWVTAISAVGDEYTIYTATGWNLFCDMLVNDSHGFLAGKTVKLAADISVTCLANKFKGSFNGQGHTLTVNYSSGAQVTAPFCYVDGATITNLVTAGTISTTKKFAAGMIGKIEGGAVSITNCTSNVTINSSVSGDGTHGGFVGLANSGSLNITGCTFSGQMLGANTTLCGGFVGYTGNGVTTTITDCLFAPSNLEIHIQWTFSRAANMNSVTITNSYYTETLGGAQGIHAITFATAWPAGEAISTYNVSGLTTYTNGIQHGDTFYTNPDMNFSVNGDEYTIHTPTGWEMFCDSLAINSYGFFTGKTVKLADNFDNSATPTTRMAVTSGHDFSGTFDGNGRTLHINITATGNYVGAFLYAIPQGNGTVVFKNLKVTGTISTAYKHAGGILGGQEGKVRIINCESSVTINSTRSGDGTHGGFVGVTSTGELIIEGCAFTGKILTTGTTATTNCAGFVGWRNNNCTATITNSIYAPATLEAGETEASTYSSTFIRNSAPGDNCYYTRTFGSAQGIHAVSNPDIQPSGNPTATYNVSGLTAYGNGLKHGTTFYYNPNTNFVLDIEGYGDVSNPGGWYLIAPPVTEAIAPSADNGFITNEFDLYFFDPSFVGEEWRNYKDENFLLNNGTGYLYASEIATTLIFTGTPCTATEPVEVALSYDPNVPELAGWNLVGNPYASTASVDRDFYVMNSTGTEIIAAEGSTVEAMEGIFVVADSDDESVTFSPMTRGTHQEERIMLNLSRNDGTVIDRAIVRFGEGKQLPKFQLNPSHTKVYIPQEGEDYAIVSVSAGRDGACTVSTEVPVNFKPEHDGTYTLTFSSENIDFDYLHLIDNLTGADIDLIHPNAVIAGEDPQSPAPSYTFTAKTTDYANRFKLVFATNDEDGPSTGSEAFAFISNGNIIVNGEGTLQVIDMLGHELYSHEVAHSSFHIPHSAFASGVYVLRLINGNDVKTQKIVVE